MSAKDKLNGSYFGWIILAAGLIGILSQSAAAFMLIAATFLIVALISGMIR